MSEPDPDQRREANWPLRMLIFAVLTMFFLLALDQLTHQLDVQPGA